jgi:hypothetical protein
MKKFIGPLLTAGTLLALLYTVYGYREQNEKLKSEREALTKHMVNSHTMVGGNNQNIIDSLQEELFLLQTQNGRYELSLQHLEELNPKAAKQFNDYLTNETE